MLVDQLRADLTAAMKARDPAVTGALRLGLAALGEASVAGDEARTLTDAEAVSVLTKAARKHEEAAEAFAAAGREERAAQERAAREVLARYLPAGLGDDELASLVDEVLRAHGLTSPTDMGAAMKAVNAEVAGRADGKAVAAIVKSRLAL
ncbi:MAG: GatB/YqeY domain-containing protein [Acidimicrobiales bacterium]|nr:GatB/YqeY domain-containing protein [Acidimicrobiales bacterium]